MSLPVNSRSEFFQIPTLFRVFLRLAACPWPTNLNLVWCHVAALILTGSELAPESGSKTLSKIHPVSHEIFVRLQRSHNPRFFQEVSESLLSPGSRQPIPAAERSGENVANVANDRNDWIPMARYIRAYSSEYPHRRSSAQNGWPYHFLAFPRTTPPSETRMSALGGAGKFFPERVPSLDRELPGAAARDRKSGSSGRDYPDPGKQMSEQVSCRCRRCPLTGNETTASVQSLMSSPANGAGPPRCRRSSRDTLFVIVASTSASDQPGGTWPCKVFLQTSARWYDGYQHGVDLFLLLDRLLDLVSPQRRTQPQFRGSDDAPAIPT